MDRETALIGLLDVEILTTSDLFREHPSTAPAVYTYNQNFLCCRSMTLLLLLLNLCILDSFSLPALSQGGMKGDPLGTILINEPLILPTIRCVVHSIH